MRDLIAAYRRMRTWVEAERRRLARTGRRPSQRYLRRARLLMDVDEVTFQELLRELRSVADDDVHRVR